MTDILIKRGTSNKVVAYTGKQGELVMDTTNKTVHLMDGSTVGGIKLAKSDDIPTIEADEGVTLTVDETNKKGTLSETYIDSCVVSSLDDVP